MGREREVKLRIASAADFHRLVQSLPPAVETHQRNTYFDTPDHALAREGMLVRVREAGGKVVLTVKRVRGRAQGRIESDEWERELAPALWASVQSGRAPLAAASFAPLDAAARGRPIAAIGSLENLRRLARGPTGALYEMDETRFPWGEVHYELEIESDEPEEELAAARALFDRLGVAYSDRVETKPERLFRGPAR